MSNQEILERAIQKAIDGGWVYPGLTDEGKIHYTGTGIVVDWLRGGRNAYAAETIIFNHDFAKALWGEASNTTEVLHDFPAKRPGFRPWKNEFGEDYGDWAHVPEELFICANPDCSVEWGASIRKGHKLCRLDGEYKIGWQHHLQQMVIADDPIKYLGEHLDG